MSQNKSIFEEVSAGRAAKPTPQGGMIDAGRGGARRGIRLWLMALFALVVAMILVGGLTRLTDSGLSITEWKPVTGALPPMSAEAWETEFAKYREIPEYQLQNAGMSLAEFKAIYWWEWGHRQLGRLVGLIWAVGFAGFLIAKKVPAGWTNRLLLIGALGGLQGAIGWWMVSSGLEGERLDVASYRLATHLGLAFVILGYIAWYIFQLGHPERDLMQRRRGRERKLWGMGTGLLHFAFLQILIGALVAGIDAGRNYIDWPLMGGTFLPPFPFELEPLWRNFFENDATVQFIHRMVAYALFLFGVGAWFASRKSGNRAVRFGFNLVLALLSLQVLLGIVTVMHGSPWSIAILHQLGAVALWVAILRARFLAGYPPAQSIRG
ncbi:heme A synthase [Poseidonocella sedimentorum]|uniref:Heme A synthase n=1 Tax=Poseidonocella sedimentorum TaxID=871652 RepID=A0A1I6CRA5_9RHOB|nr:heme A synthase [Poseidonocella sedimentorum]SFQ95700.1 cytochrome c oxidase assembly protein subunit 15 [Poseidonocella sedimentorum]